MHIAMIGTRGVPAAYGGFETAVEEIGRRLVKAGHQVTVYTRVPKDGQRLDSHLGMALKPLPAIKKKSIETLSHTGLSVGHVVTRRAPDMAFLFNAANAPYLPALRARRIPVATHVDGLEWKRAKWGAGGRRYYRMAESLAVRYSDALIADARGIAEYYADEFGATTDLIKYGAPIILPTDGALAGEGLPPGGFHLIVARFERENHVLEGVAGYVSSRARHPLVVVGSAPFAAEYTRDIKLLAQGDPRVRMIGRVDDQARLDALYADALTYIHGHSVGGTNPSLLRAMGAGTATIAYDVVFNREVLGGDGRFFADPHGLAGHLEAWEADADDANATGHRLRERAAANYNWDDVAAKYEELAARLVAGESQAGRFTGRRSTGGRTAPADVDLTNGRLVDGSAEPVVDLRRGPDRSGAEQQHR